MAFQFILIALATGGLVLPVTGAVRAYHSGRRAIKKARHDSERIAAIRESWANEQGQERARLGQDYDGEVVNEKYARLFLAEELVVPNWDYSSRNAAGDLTIVRVLELIVESNLSNVGLIFLGAVCSYVATLLAILYS
ncbi:hypothetical protein [Frondihabitans sucicola]|uniref:hypothetical protein n=1 Tax=Frondihabitans sucicola TaxID=1268041 RepID=UPI002573F3DA|nr:hypothetical protein [Frondihabitans sucicola]